MIIDVHHHWVPREFVDNVEKYLRPNEKVVWQKGVANIYRDGFQVCTRNPEHCNMEAQLRDMDAAGVDMGVFSVAVWQDWTTMKTAPFINDQMAEMQAKYSKRFIGMAHVPPFEEGAPEELERAVKKLGLRGACITTHCQGKYPGDDAYRPLYKKAAELDIPIFIHAAPAMAGHEFLTQDKVTAKFVRLFGRAIDHTLAVIRLIGSGILKDFPTLKFINGHIGGTWFVLSDRFLAPAHPLWNTTDDPRKYVGQLYFDTAPSGWKQPHLDCAAATIGADNLVFGTDFPSAAMDSMGVNRGLVEGLSVSKKDKDKILGGNAAKLFKIKKKA
ncbi:MAG: amidohydrolase [Chloroflexi bacterium]|nr:amidohydrolase [Chloroflexota bacterium]